MLRRWRAGQRRACRPAHVVPWAQWPSRRLRLPFSPPTRCSTRPPGGAQCCYFWLGIFPRGAASCCRVRCSSSCRAFLRGCPRAFPPSAPPPYRWVTPGGGLQGFIAAQACLAAYLLFLRRSPAVLSGPAPVGHLGPGLEHHAPRGRGRGGQAARSFPVWAAGAGCVLFVVHRWAGLCRAVLSACGEVGVPVEHVVILMGMLLMHLLAADSSGAAEHIAPSAAGAAPSR